MIKKSIVLMHLLIFISSLNLFAASVSDKSFRSPKRIYLKTADLMAEGELTQFKPEYFSKNYLLYKNTCDINEARHPVPVEQIEMTVGANKYLSHVGSSSQSSLSDGQISYIKYYHDVFYRDYKRCADINSDDNQITKVRISFYNVSNYNDEMSLLWRTDSHRLTLFKFDYDKNRQVEVGTGQVLEWH